MFSDVLTFTQLMAMKKKAVGVKKNVKNKNVNHENGQRGKRWSSKYILDMAFGTENCEKMKKKKMGSLE